jgi:hypothetical protein
MLRGPAVDLALALASAALAFAVAVHAARAGWPNAAALCLAALFGALAWARAVLPLASGGAEGEDG